MARRLGLLEAISAYLVYPITHGFDISELLELPELANLKRSKALFKLEGD